MPITKLRARFRTPQHGNFGAKFNAEQPSPSRFIRNWYSHYSIYSTQKRDNPSICRIVRIKHHPFEEPNLLNSLEKQVESSGFS